ncbi:DUF6923 family protein, partial [Microbacterium sp. 22179]|uniref:DUF6923 family protein n=1 Tax=Microbacterium sp. 22179 TaxID=3453886 RepID=UPI003F869F41
MTQEHETSPPRRWRRGALTVGAGVTVAGLCVMGGITAASAAAGDPFNPEDGAVYIIQASGENVPVSTTLYRATIDPATGKYEFDDEWRTTIKDGTAPVRNTSFAMNALAYNPADQMMYVAGWTGEDDEGFRIYRMGQQGRIEVLPSDPEMRGFGPLSYAAAINPEDGYYYASSSPGGFGTVVDVFDLEDGSVVRTFRVGTGFPYDDFDFIGGYMFGVQDGNLVRVDPITGAVMVIGPVGTSGGRTGAVWRYGNGNLGVSENSTGDVFQLKIDNPASSNPTFRVVGKSKGPKNSRNDGTAIPGAPADLQLEKSGPNRFMVGNQIEYTFTVTNKGDSLSTGWVINDLLPNGLSNPVLVSGAASVDSTAEGERTRVYMTGGALDGGESATITIRVDTADTLGAFPDDDGDPSNGLCFSNIAELFGNEDDQNPLDNTAAAGCATPYDSSLALDKSVSQIIDVNNNGITDEGDQIIWSFEVTNDGRSNLTNVTIDDPLLAEYGIVVSGGSPSLAAGESTTFVSDVYTITEEDAEAGEVRNVAVARGDSPNGVPDKPESPEDGTTTEVEDPDPGTDATTDADASADPTANVNAAASASASAKADDDSNPSAQVAAQA